MQASPLASGEKLVRVLAPTMTRTRGLPKHDALPLCEDTARDSVRTPSPTVWHAWCENSRALRGSSLEVRVPPDPGACGKEWHHTRPPSLRTSCAEMGFNHPLGRIGGAIGRAIFRFFLKNRR